MRSLSMAELGQVSGGLLKTSATGSGLGSGTKSGSAHPNLLPPGGGGGGGGYYGYLGGITGLGNYGGDDYADWGASYSGVAVSSNDTVKIGEQTSADDYQCKLVGPTGLQEAEGVFEVLAGSFDVASGLVMTVGSDGLLIAAGIGTAAVGVAGIANGVGKFDMHLECQPKAISGEDEIHSPSVDSRTAVA